LKSRKYCPKYTELLQISGGGLKMEHYKLFIDGEFIEAASGDVFETIDLMSINSTEAQKFRDEA
jgi:hypothetical protein